MILANDLIQRVVVSAVVCRRKLGWAEPPYKARNFLLIIYGKSGQFWIGRFGTLMVYFVKVRDLHAGIQQSKLILPCSLATLLVVKIIVNPSIRFLVRVKFREMLNSDTGQRENVAYSTSATC